jgi:hypothetical protein
MLSLRIYIVYIPKGHACVQHGRCMYCCVPIITVYRVAIVIAEPRHCIVFQGEGISLFCGAHASSIAILIQAGVSACMYDVYITVMFFYAAYDASSSSQCLQAVDQY